MKVISKDNLVTLLLSIKGATFATICTDTDARLKKTGNPYGQVRKLSRVNVCLGFQYKNAVNRQRLREGSEGDFEAEPRQWGRRVPGTMFVEHNDKLYLETKVEKSLNHTYFAADGTMLTEEQVAPYLPARSKSSRQETEKEILVRDYALDSIRSLSFGSEVYLLLHDLPETMAVKVKQEAEFPG
jgi:hypothetical protein